MKEESNIELIKDLLELFCIFTFLLFFIESIFHPFIYCKYFFKTFLNNNTSAFFVSSAELYLDSYYKNSLDISEYFSKSSNKLKKINISNFNDDDDYISITAQYTNKINKCNIYINNISIKSNINTDYDLFNKDYINKTIITLIRKENLIENDINKIDFRIKDNIYTYYFYVENN